MSKIKPMALVESMSGKVCEHSDVYFRTNKQTGNVTTGKLCNPRDVTVKPYSSTELANQSLFKAKSAAVRAELSDATKKAAWEAKYKAQHEIGSLFGYVFAKSQFDASGNIVSE